MLVIQFTALLIKMFCTNSYVDGFILVCVDLSKRKVRIFLYFTQQKIVLSGVRPLVEFYQTYPPDTAELSSEDDTQRLG